VRKPGTEVLKYVADAFPFDPVLVVEQAHSNAVPGLDRILLGAELLDLIELVVTDRKLFPECVVLWLPALASCSGAGLEELVTCWAAAETRPFYEHFNVMLLAEATYGRNFVLTAH